MYTACAPGRRSVERHRPRRLRADGVEDEVGAEPLGRRRARPRAPRRASPKASCAPSASARSRRCAWGSRTLTCSMPDSSAAWRVIRPIVPAPSTTARADRVAGQPEAHRVHAVGQRLDERADARRDAVGQRAHVGRRGGDEVGEGAVVVDADQRAPRAQVLLAGGAQPAVPAAGQRVDGHARAVPRAGAGAGGDDHARELVAHHQRRRAVAHVAQVALDLRAADADGLGAHDQLAGAGVVAARGAPRSPCAPARATRSPSSPAASHARAVLSSCPRAGPRRGAACRRRRPSGSDGSSSITAGFSLGSGSASASAAVSVSTTPRSWISRDLLGVGEGVTAQAVGDDDAVEDVALLVGEHVGDVAHLLAVGGEDRRALLQGEVGDRGAQVVCPAHGGESTPMRH